MIKAKVIMIGANLKGIETELKHAGIRCTEFISNCSPLSMTGKHDENLLELSKKNDDMPIHLDIKKNLAQMLSKDPENFVQNYNTIPYGKNVEYFNPAEYIIVSNTSLAYDIYSNGEFVYTAYAGSEFSDFIVNDDSYQKVDFSRGEFNWRGLYECFVDTILKVYDSKHIILVKTNQSSYYMDGSEIRLFGSEYDPIGSLICEADKIFAQKTNCIEIDEAYNNIPSEFDRECPAPFARFGNDCVYDISRIIEDIIINGMLPEKIGGTYANINDIISLYLEYENSVDKAAATAKVKKLAEDKTALPIIKAKKFRKNNMEFLAKYHYISESFKSVPNDERVYVRLSNCVYMVLAPGSKPAVYKIELPISETADYERVIEDGYICSIGEAGALCGSLAFYIERARRGCGQKAIRIVFNSKEEFYESLNYIDYPDLLENESFLLGLKNDQFDMSGYNIRCDLSFFFDPNVKICALDNGLGDQITYYIFAKRLEDYTGSEIYFDDLVYYLDYIMNDREIDNIIKEDISGRMFSNIFTRRLLLNFKIGDVVPDKLAENGLRELTVIANNNVERGNAVKKCNKICLCSIRHDYIDKILNCGLYPLYFNYYIRPEWLMTLRPFDLREYLEFPKTKGKNKEIEEKMLGCDAVAVQVRCGDYLRLGWASKTEFYAEVLGALSAMADYPNKKYFVFSDDIPWVKTHSKEIGLDTVCGEIFYIDHNKAEDSLFDMYLISLAKVIVGSASGFAKMGALFSSRCEDFFCSNAKVKRIFEAVGRGNKHDIAFSYEAIPNYSRSLEIRTIARKQNAGV